MLTTTNRSLTSIFAKLSQACAAICIMALPALANAQADQVTFHKDIEPILQRSCQNCHRPGGVGPMSLVSFDEVAPFAGLIEYKTGLRDRAGAMPPWYMERDIGIQDYKFDPSLSDEELAAISTWARSGTPQGDPADAPEPLVFSDDQKWTAGQPDLIVSTNDVTKLAGTPDWWGEIDRIAIPIEEDRYVKSVEIIEVNDNQELTPFNPQSLKTIELGALEVSKVSDNSTYWSPETIGEFKLVFFDSLSTDTVVNQETGEEKLLPSVNMWEQKEDCELSRISNSSARLVGVFERMRYPQGTPLKITFEGKVKNKNNSYKSDSWSVNRLYPKG